MAWRGFDFSDLLAVPARVEGHQNQPLICVQRAEGGKRVYGSVFVQGDSGVAGKTNDAGALLFKPLFGLR